MKTRAIIDENIYVSNIISSINRFKHNRIVHKLISEVEQIDSISSYKQFGDVIINNKKLNSNDFEYADLRYYGESLLYGHLDALYEYAGAGKPNYFAFPKMEHGANPTIDPVPQSIISKYPTFIYQSKYKSNQIHNVNELKPVFSIGPYVHYAKSIYNSDCMSNLKMKYGKILLVFPFHNFEKSISTAKDDIFVKYVMKNLAKDYDTVFVCAYWNDIDLKIYQIFKSEGAVLVSCGFRGDKNFINRLKTIIELSDAVCGNSFGTHIGYALYLDKPYYHIDNNLVFGYKEKEFSDEQKTTLGLLSKELQEAFGTHRRNIDLQTSLFKRYWGGKDEIKSQAEIRSILSVGNVILKHSMGCTNRFDNVVQNLLNGDFLSSQEMCQLRSSLE